MKTPFCREHGFTLVELAIVMTIVALLIGGVLKGQEMIQNSRITATLAQVQAYKAATTAFQDAYRGGLPGDTPAFGLTSEAPETPEDGFIGLSTWGSATEYTPLPGSLSIVACPSGMCASITPAAEPMNFWSQLSSMGYVSGIAGGEIGFGLSHPAAASGGGFVVGYMDGHGPQGFPGSEGPVGHALMLVQDLQDAALEQKPLLVKRAAQMDRRIDDGIPTSGIVVAYGDNATCFTGDGSKIGGYVTGSYDENASKTRDCGLFFLME